MDSGRTCLQYSIICVFSLKTHSHICKSHNKSCKTWFDLQDWAGNIWKLSILRACLHPQTAPQLRRYINIFSYIKICTLISTLCKLDNPIAQVHQKQTKKKKEKENHCTKLKTWLWWLTRHNKKLYSLRSKIECKVRESLCMMGKEWG